MKCLPASKLPQARGTVLHDWHAEVLAIRAFNRFVLEECRQLALRPDAESLFLRRRTPADHDEVIVPASAGPPFLWRPDVRLHMYCSEAPCGDASMELTMAAQEDAAPWEVPAPAAATTTSTVRNSGTPPPETAPLPGRAYFSLLGAVRRKPARADAAATASKSCSDKLALRQCVSLLSSAASLLVAPGPTRRCPLSPTTSAHPPATGPASETPGFATEDEDQDHASPVYIRTLVLPTAQYSARGCQRAFGGDGGEGSGRMAPLSPQPQPQPQPPRWDAGYAFHPFAVRTTASEFTFSRRAVALRGALTACNLAVAWTAPALLGSGSGQEPGSGMGVGMGIEESTLAGLVRGRKAVDARGRGASALCRRTMWALAVEVAGLLASSDPDSVAEVRRALAGSAAREGEQPGTYAAVKASALLAPRRRVKEDVWAVALRGWVRNEGDDGFVL